METTLLFMAVLVAAGTDWVAVAKGWKKIETIAKPATMVLLFIYLAVAGGFGATPLIFFGLGIFFSLAGDIFLMGVSDRWFLPGLAAFLLAHGSYIIGLNTPFALSSPLWATCIGILLAITAGRVLRRILTGVREKGLQELVVPVMVYGTVITLMLLSAILTFYRLGWKTSASGLVSLGAILFYLSDIILAWNKFVTPINYGRVMNMIAYHLGQIALITGIVLQFGK
jgi:alkenylglycerophosphocholine/alkenylglycerophosphoethanolamine hydrolase